MNLEEQIKLIVENNGLKLYDIVTKKDLMESVFYETIWSNLAVNPATHDAYDLTKLSSYLILKKMLKNQEKIL